MLLPKRGPLPQISQTCAMVKLQIIQGLSAPPERLARWTENRVLVLPNLQYISERRESATPQVVSYLRVAKPMMRKWATFDHA
jgi:hypothetical protein